MFWADVSAITEVGEGATMSGYSWVEEVVHRRGLLALSRGFFTDCFRLRSVNVHECPRLGGIREGAFGRCVSLRSVEQGWAVSRLDFGEEWPADGVWRMLDRSSPFARSGLEALDVSHLEALWRVACGVWPWPWPWPIAWTRETCGCPRHSEGCSITPSRQG